MSAPKITACQVLLLEAADRIVARGVVAIDADGPPPVIFYDGQAYLPTLKVAGEQCYRKARVFYAGPSFEALA